MGGGKQTIVQIRAVVAYVGESKALQTYSDALQKIKNLGIKCGLVRGTGIGCIQFTTYSSYALLIWFGGIAVRHHYANGALVNTTISVIMIGGQYVPSNFKHLSKLILKINVNESSAAGLWDKQHQF